NRRRRERTEKNETTSDDSFSDRLGGKPETKSLNNALRLRLTELFRQDSLKTQLVFPSGSFFPSGSSVIFVTTSPSSTSTENFAPFFHMFVMGSFTFSSM